MRILMKKGVTNKQCTLHWQFKGTLPRISVRVKEASRTKMLTKIHQLVVPSCNNFSLLNYLSSL